MDEVNEQAQASKQPTDKSDGFVDSTEFIEKINTLMRISSMKTSSLAYDLGSLWGIANICVWAAILYTTTYVGMPIIGTTILVIIATVTLDKLVCPLVLNIVEKYWEKRFKLSADSAEEKRKEN